jgi:hypothetical protein
MLAARRVLHGVQAPADFEEDGGPGRTAACARPQVLAIADASRVRSTQPKTARRSGVRRQRVAHALLRSAQAIGR